MSAAGTSGLGASLPSGLDSGASGLFGSGASTNLKHEPLFGIQFGFYRKLGLEGLAPTSEDMA